MCLLKYFLNLISEDNLYNLDQVGDVNHDTAVEFSHGIEAIADQAESPANQLKNIFSTGQQQKQQRSGKGSLAAEGADPGRGSTAATKCHQAYAEHF